MTITELQYLRAMEKLAFHQAEAEKYIKITRQYNYNLEAERVKNRKVDSDKYHRENPMQ